VQKNEVVEFAVRTVYCTVKKMEKDQKRATGITVLHQSAAADEKYSLKSFFFGCSLLLER